MTTFWTHLGNQFTFASTCSVLWLQWAKVLFLHCKVQLGRMWNGESFVKEINVGSYMLKNNPTWSPSHSWVARTWLLLSLSPGLKATWGCGEMGDQSRPEGLPFHPSSLRRLGQSQTFQSLNTEKRISEKDTGGQSDLQSNTFYSFISLAEFVLFMGY